MKIIYEDKDILVVDKPAGMVVDEGAGRERETVVSWLLQKYPEMAQLAWPIEAQIANRKSQIEEKRIGLVHRLDKDTSGLLVIAKTPKSQKSLMSQWKGRKVEKEYIALVFGKVEPKRGRIELPIGRAPIQRQKMAAISGGREAITEFEVLSYYKLSAISYKLEFSLLKVRILTGRTHQIRVHLAKIGYPVMGDFVYGNKSSIKASKEIGLIRQFLHASKLSFTHPTTKKKLTFESPLPEDLQIIISHLQI